MLLCGRASPAKKKERTKASSPKNPKKRVYMNIQYHAVCSAAGSGITQSQGSMSKPILGSSLNVQERSAQKRVIGRAFSIGKYI
jgi:hypothetical protein